ncbi:helix-turn-helix domain-containing protein [Pseudomonas sp. gcc21]|uniref:helix-turn-helix transcriptional regulator n=1 Tax=Pseudomonas sp. gcc21 TaxID=2726989 RepID=UPI0014512E87|nr:helix-turn-helix domain-containing protein [Pseudomonas sp. gcc21]
MITSEVLKTTDEICAILRVSRQTLWRLTKENPSLPGRVRIGRLTRWSEKELIGWLSSQ